MLSRKQRLSKTLFSTVFSQGRVISGEYFLLRIAPLSPQEKVRCAVAVSKKQAKRAVDRVYTRRTVYRALGELLAESTGFGIIVFPRKPILDYTDEQIQVELKRLLEKASVLP